MGNNPALHPIFSKFKPWEGMVPAGFIPGFMGAIVSDDFYEGVHNPNDRFVRTGYPPADEELFEHISLLKAIDTAADGRFTMLELGAGYGRWLITAAKAAEQRGLACYLVGVEAEPSHYKMMIEHFSNNGLEPNDHYLVDAAITDHDGEVTFAIGSPRASWGQAIVESDYQWPDKKLVRAISLSIILRRLDLVDLIDLDVQGEEFKVLDAARDMLGKVKRVHIGTHGHDIEENLRRLFLDLGWICEYDYPFNSQADTPFGRITFQDGVQDWINVNL